MNSATLAAAALKAQRQLDGLSSAPRNRLPRIDSVGNLGRDSSHRRSLISLFTCSDLRSCQVYGSKNLANIEGVEHESVVEFGGGGVKYGRWSVVSPVRPAVRNF